MSDAPIEYVRVRYTHNDSQQMVPVEAATLLVERGEAEIVDPTPGPYRPVNPETGDLPFSATGAPGAPGGRP